MFVRVRVPHASPSTPRNHWILPEIGTFLIAGHSTAMSWTLFGLCQNLEAQRKLREELLALATDNPTMDELRSLPYLDMAVREYLWPYSPVFVSRKVRVRVGPPSREYRMAEPGGG